MNTTKKTAFGILGAAATAVLALGVSAPAFADDHDSSTTHTKVLTKVLGDIGLSNESPIVIAPEVSTGDVLSGNANGTEVGNGNVVGSGNDTAIGSGNDTGIDVGVSDLLDSTVGDVTGGVSGLLGDLDLRLDALFED